MMDILGILESMPNTLLFLNVKTLFHANNVSKSLIYLEFILIQSVNNKFDFIFFHMAN